MLIALFADIHANRQAFEACLADARANGAEHLVLLGDLVGYGGDPDWVVETAMTLVGDGAAAVLGNHDSAVSQAEQLNPVAQIAMEFTRGELSRAHRDFLAGLPMTVQEQNRLYVHADASDPKHWNYVTGTVEASRSLIAANADMTFCGHVHRPALYCLSSTAKMTAHTPTTGVQIPLLPGRRWLAVLGAVGQPRDGNPAAAYAMLDSEKRELTFCRAPYDVEAAAQTIRKRGLPPSLAERLAEGR